MKTVANVVVVVVDVVVVVVVAPTSGNSSIVAFISTASIGGGRASTNCRAGIAASDVVHRGETFFAVDVVDGSSDNFASVPYGTSVCRAVRYPGATAAIHDLLP